MFCKATDPDPGFRFLLRKQREALAAAGFREERGRLPAGFFCDVPDFNPSCARFRQTRMQGFHFLAIPASFSRILQRLLQVPLQARGHTKSIPTEDRFIFVVAFIGTNPMYQ